MKNADTTSHQPLADRIRPKRLSEFIGQEHILAKGRMLHRAIENDQLMSMILWGPPGVGKTTLARIIARETHSEFHTISAVTSGVADIRKILAIAGENREQYQKGTIFFIDEIHRFNKSQQDALLHSVEDGTVLLIGATTENPSFEVIPALLSRCRIYKLHVLSEQNIRQIIHRALERDSILQEMAVQVKPDAERILIDLSGGDARNALMALELAIQLQSRAGKNKIVIHRSHIEEAMQKRALLYDKKGEYHYDVISAYIKSVRGSDPDAAVYWLARMLHAGEDPLFIARRIVVLASEDIGNSDPHALLVATSAFQAVERIGMPEARIVLAQATLYLASAPKSNAAYLAIDRALADIEKQPPGDVPLHLRNAPTRMMKDFDYAKGYKYPHDYKGFVEQSYFPANRSSSVYYHPTDNGIEKKIKERLEKLWPKRKR